LVAVTNRRVGRLNPARAEPSGVLDSFIERFVAGLDVDGVDVDGVAAAGLPHTLQ
jgi:hypothetical protein